MHFQHPYELIFRAKHRQGEAGQTERVYFKLRISNLGLRKRGSLFVYSWVGRVRPIVIFWLLGRYLIPGISKMSNIRPKPNNT